MKQTVLAPILLASLLVGCAAEARLRGDGAFHIHKELNSLRLEVKPNPDEEAPQDKKGDPVEGLKDDVRKTMDKASKMNPYEMLMGDVNLMKEHMMPGRRPDLRKKFTEFCFVTAAILWFIIYTMFFYEPDRCENLERWAGAKVDRRVEDPRINVMSPDLVLVFHNPGFEYKDKGTPVTKDELQAALVRNSKPTAKAKEQQVVVKDPKLERTAKLLDGCEVDMASRVSERVRRGSGATKAADPAEQEQKPADSEKTCLGDVRVALLQDIYDLLPSLGFDVDVFTSVDGDELIVGVALHDPTTINRLLTGMSARLQVQHDVVKDLGIAQDPTESESSPPWMEYNTTLASNVLGEGKEDIDFFEAFGKHGDAKRNPNGTILSGQQRIRIIYQYLNRFLNLDFAVEHGMLVSWFPAHSPGRIHEMQSSWARWSLLTDMTFVQPLTHLSDYFGSRVAFIFAWNGFYCKLLLALLPVAVMFEVANAISVSTEGKYNFWNRGSVLGFALVIVVWARLGRNLWCREENYLVSLWDLNNKATERSSRPDFYGEWRESVIDKNIKEIYYPKWKSMCRMAASWLITLVFCTFVFLTFFIWLDLWQGRMNLGATIVQAVLVQIFTQIFNVMAESLTVAENHHYQSDYYNSYLKKMFVFQFVNQYCAFFYIGVKQQFTAQGCVNDDCVGMIKANLPTTLGVLAIMRVVQVVIATLMVKIKLWWEARQIVKAGGEKPIYSFVEEQAKYGDFRIREQIEVMTQLCLTLGYVLIFGAIAPRIVPLCFAVFACQLRAAAVLVTTAACRTVPRSAIGIGPWSGVVQALLVVGVLFTGYLLVQFGPLFHGTVVLTKLSGLIIYGLCVAILWAFIDLVFPPVCPSTAILDGRRSYVKQRILQKSEDAIFDKNKPEQAPGAPGWNPFKSQGKGESSHPHSPQASEQLHRMHCCQEVEAGEWDKIPKALKED